MKNLLLLISLFISAFSSAQTFGAVEIEGNIKVPAEADPQGITIFNKNSGKGSVSTEKGTFTIYAQLNDSLYFSALQYKDLLFVVDEQTIRSRTLNVEITENINDLPEVVVRPHDLTGRLDIDAENIETVNPDLPTMTAMSISDYDWEWRQDGQTAVTNAAMPGGGLKNGADPIAILAGIVGLILPPKKAKERPPSPRNQHGLINLERELRERYDDAFFKDALKIEPRQISDFIWYINKAGFPSKLLRKEMELDLIQFLVEQSAKFNDQ